MTKRRNDNQGGVAICTVAVIRSANVSGGDGEPMSAKVEIAFAIDRSNADALLACVMHGSLVRLVLTEHDE